MIRIAISWKTEREAISSLRNASAISWQRWEGNMSKLFKRRLFSRLRKDAARPGLKASIALGLTLSAAALLAPIQAHAAGGPIVQTNEGPVQGFQTKGITEFLGVPFAAPPVGNLRWMPPVSHAPWTTVLQATSFGSNCPQNANHVFAGPVNLTDESCLFLNIFTPDLGIPLIKLPVIFWIYGGGNLEGESTDYDASKLAAQGHTVVVTVNYRLGSLGFLAVPALDAEGHPFGNYGLLDQQFGMKWVKQNIAKFGGDPNNVTIGGQSAGSEDTEADVVSPLAKGLFNRAIFESIVTEPQLLATAEASGTTFANDANCNAANGDTTNPEIAACLRALTVLQILPPALPGHSSLIGDGTILPLQPAVVSPTQPGAFYLAFQSGNYNQVPIMSGTVEDEANFGLALTEYNAPVVDTPGIPYLPGGPQTPYSAAQYAAAIAAYPTTVTPYTSPLTVQAYVSEHYPLISSTPPGPQLSIDPLTTDHTTCPQHRINRLIATGPNPSPVYAYEFDDRTAPFYFPPLLDFVSLAYHTADLQYLFPLFHGGPAPPSVIHTLNPLQELLSAELVAAWTNLAWTGNPNGIGNFPWPRYQGSNSNSYYLLENLLPSGLSRQTDAQFAARHNCNFWDTYLTP
jgi:para-nitrobenzyl esterase